jgi:F-type H+-transporting ATPase subunit alpha
LYFEKEIATHGLIISTGCGVATLQGYSRAFIMEVFTIDVLPKADFAHLALGLIVNLYENLLGHLVIAALLLYPEYRLASGHAVTGRSRLASIFLGDFVLGSILDPLGNFLSYTFRIHPCNLTVVEGGAPPIIDRRTVYEPMQTGLISVDSCVPIGRGQRELIIGDRRTGKTSLAVDAILNQKYEKVLSVYLPVGQKASSILEVYMALIRRDAIFYLVVLTASAACSAVRQYLSCYTASALSEFFMILRELAVLLCLDIYLNMQ